jgi:hypothetical protein
MVYRIARLMWLLPALLIVLTVALVKAGFDQHTTYEQGIPAQGTVSNVVLESRAEVTFGQLDVAVTLDDGTSLQETLPLPLSLLHKVKDQSVLPVRVLPGTSQPILIDEIARAQWRMSLINAVMAGIGAILLIIGVGAWNRYLRQEGDPGLRSMPGA